VHSRTRIAALFCAGALLAGCTEARTPVTPVLDTSAPDLAASAGSIRLSSITAGHSTACGLAPSGRTYCWGEGAGGQLGSGADASSPVPVAVSGGLSFASIHSAWEFTCGLTRSGEAYCWGQNQFGQFGNGTTSGSNVPVRAGGDLRFHALTVGVYHACGLTARGEAYCWGSSRGGGMSGNALGAPTTALCENPAGGYRGAEWPCSTTPLLVSGGLRFRSISAGLMYTCGTTTAGDSYCWGWNFFNQLGDGTTTDRTEPTEVLSERRFASVNAGATHTCGIADDGEALCWGGRAFNWGQLGNGAFVGSSTPTPVVGGLRFASISPSRANNIYTFTCGVTRAGESYCWGSNRFGQIGGAGDLQTCSTMGGGIPCTAAPVAVEGDLTLSALSTGSEFACGVARGGRAYCWGRNDSGQLGNGTRTNASVPTPLSAP
jgi:alpha-tubulin suppressor-like RCC1 family protein